MCVCVCILTAVTVSPNTPVQNGDTQTMRTTQSKIESLKNWSISTYKCTKQLMYERLGKTSRTVDFGEFSLEGEKRSRLLEFIASVQLFALYLRTGDADRVAQRHSKKILQRSATVASVSFTFPPRCSDATRPRRSIFRIGAEIAGASGGIFV